MFQWLSAKRTSGEKEGAWPEKVTSSVCWGGGGADERMTTVFIITLYSLCQYSHSRFIYSVSLYPALHPPTHQGAATPTLTPSLSLPTPSLLPPPPTHVHVHPQYTVGSPILVQWIPTSHFGLRMEQEVVRQPEDNQQITDSTHIANNDSIHIHCTIHHIESNTVLNNAMHSVLSAQQC